MKHVLIALGGVQSPNPLPEIAWDQVIAVDSGGDSLLALGIPAHLVIGDLDSINSESLKFHKMHGSKISNFPTDKNETDLELALQNLSTAPGTEIHLINMWGGRFDHSIMNLLVLSKFVLKGFFTFDTADGFGGVMGPGELAIHAPLGSGAALMALSPVAEDIRSTGVKWPLKNDELKFGESRGISNIVQHCPWRISFLKGSLCWLVSGSIRAKAGIEWYP